MSAIIAISLKKEDLKKIEEKKGYLNLTVLVDDKLGNYGHNVSVIAEQTKEQRDAKEKRTYVGNGKVVYVRDGIKTAKDLESSNEGSSSDPW
jgi:hypothetical protein